jgi:hypothetical protein
MSGQTEQSPQSRLLGAGWSPCMGGLWLSADGHRILTLEQALAELGIEVEEDR